MSQFTCDGHLMAWPVPSFRRWEERGLIGVDARSFARHRMSCESMKAMRGHTCCVCAGLEVHNSTCACACTCTCRRHACTTRIATPSISVSAFCTQLGDACPMRALVLLAVLPSVLAEQPCEDSPALTTIWESTSTGNSDRLIDTLIQNHDFATHRSSDCRGPLFWAFEFKNVDALALYMHLEVDLEQTDQGGQQPKDMFDGSEEDMQGARLSLRTRR